MDRSPRPQELRRDRMRDLRHLWRHPRDGGQSHRGDGPCGLSRPGFPDKFMPFMDAPPGSTVSAHLIGIYGRFIRNLRGFTNETANKEPKWRHRRPELTTGYRPVNYAKGKGATR